GLGFSIVGGARLDTRRHGNLREDRLPRGAAAMDGRLREGDELLEVNGEPVRGLTHLQAIATFKRLPRGVVTLAVRAPFCGAATFDLAFDVTFGLTPSSGHVTGKASDPMDQIVVEVTLMKERGVGLGIGVCCVSAERGTGAADPERSPRGPRGAAGPPRVFILSLAPGSAAQLSGRLRRGDQVLEVAGRSLCRAGRGLAEAFALLSEREPGPVTILVSRHTDPTVSERAMHEAILRPGASSAALGPSSTLTTGSNPRLAGGSTLRP
ncbi:PDZ domain-containing protein 2-like, partial [Lethenteron reissneri]|uniref:PDZ domain-containing protein 2-like n=1 Tax=Lethenteron reissneri TaxID=7753 RepID=UPI002AB75A45